MKIALVFLFAILLDHFWGEPKRLHPLVGFGNLASLLEKKLNTQEEGAQAPIISRIYGMFAVIVLIAPFVAITAVVEKTAIISFIIDVFVLYLALAAKSLSA